MAMNDREQMVKNEINATVEEIKMFKEIYENRKKECEEYDRKIRNETLDKVMAEIDKMERDELYLYTGDKLRDLKSAIIAMKKETKTG